jgi:lipopolysaccharide/colanic/teichoic acid biosynthesis glycosyltransferase
VISPLVDSFLKNQILRKQTRVPEGRTWPQAARKPFNTVLAKRLLDIVVSGTALLLLSGLFGLVALMVVIDSPGPVFYHQIRVGQNRRYRDRRRERIPVGQEQRAAERRRILAEGRLFWIHKFRTMIVDAEHGMGPVWALKDDPRATRVGKWLRKLRLDELPQLWNVLRGEMSLVGPRPERPHFVGHFALQIPNYVDRLRVPPGITGLAQVERSYDACEEDVRHKLTYDLTYIRNLCLSQDFRILFRTVQVVLGRKGV